MGDDFSAMPWARVAAPAAQGVSPQSAAWPVGAHPSATPLEVLRDYEQSPRRRLLRILSLGVMIPVILLIPAALIPTVDQVTLIALAIALLGAIVAFALTLGGWVTLGGFALTASLSLAIAWEIVTKALAQHGVDLVDTRLYDLLVLPIVVSGIVMGRRGPIVFGAISIAFTTASLIQLPHTTPLQQYWDGKYTFAIIGSVYDVIAVPCVIQLLGAIATWLGADSVRRTLLEAARADGLATANAQIQAQTRAIEVQHYRLYQDIAQLQSVHAAVARGQWDARANITDGELLPVALSLNLLLDRISRLTHEVDERARMEAASRELAAALRRLSAGQPYTPPSYTSTPLDGVLAELARLQAVPPPPPPSAARPNPANVVSITPAAPAPSNRASSGPFLNDYSASLSGMTNSAGGASGVHGSGLPLWLGGSSGAGQSDPQSFSDPGASFPGASAAQPPPSTAEQWPDLSAGLEPARSGATDALPPWLRGDETASQERPAGSSSEPEDEATNYLPPWLQDMH